MAQEIDLAPQRTAGESAESQGNKTMKHGIGACALVLALAVVISLADGDESDVNHACAVLYSTAGNKAAGTVHFEQVGKEVKISGRVTGLSPGKHGLHVHMFGDCSAPDASSAGDHFNPSHRDHAGPRDPNRHVGDLGNIDAGRDGVANFTMVDSTISLLGANSIVGRGVIVHAKEDDLRSQPAGETGANLACGVVGIGKPK
jgi:Cu-Zn family superoxide dismutase